MNKRGDLPITILVIGVFAVCTLALVSFFYSSYKIQKSLIGIDIIEEANSKIESEGLEHLYVEDVVTRFSPELGFDWLKKKVIFSLEYNP